jgi:hypothetical protein
MKASEVHAERKQMLLPEGLQFPKLGWWLTHVLYLLLVYSYGYRRGRREEQKSRRVGDPSPAPR